MIDEAYRDVLAAFDRWWGAHVAGERESHLWEQYKAAEARWEALEGLPPRPAPRDLARMDRVIAIAEARAQAVA